MHGGRALGGLKPIYPEFNGINHNRKGRAFEIEQPKVGPKGEPSGSERVKGHNRPKGDRLPKATPKE